MDGAQYPLFAMPNIRCSKVHENCTPSRVVYDGFGNLLEKCKKMGMG